MKAYGLLTGHHVDAARVPDALKRMLPATARAKDRGVIPNCAFGNEARSWAFSELRNGLKPLRDAGKLGYVLFQFAPWVKRSDEALAQLSKVCRELPDDDIAVEFRSRSWFDAHTDETLRFLQQHGLTYVSIDGPRSRITVPSLPVLTTPTAVFRLHGRNFNGFLAQLQGKMPTVAEKYDYLYSKPELEEIAGAAGALNGEAERVHVAMNNNRGDYPAINGMQLREMLLEDWCPPDRKALIQELHARRAKSRARSKGGTMHRLILVTVLMVSCWSFSGPTRALAQHDPIAIARRYVDAVNRGDVAAVVSLFTDDATVSHGRVCTPACVADPAAVRRQYEQDAANGVKLTIVNAQVSGSAVAVRLEIRGNPMRAAGMDRIVGTDAIEVRGEKIVSLRFTPDSADTQTARFREWVRTQAQPPRQ